MNLDRNAKEAVQNLSDAVSAAVEKSFDVCNAVEILRELGYEPNLTIKLEIGLHEINENAEGISENCELDLTDEDLRTLRKMKIRF